MSKSTKDNEESLEHVSADILCVSASHLHNVIRILVSVCQAEGVFEGDGALAESEKYEDEMLALVNGGGEGEREAYARTVTMLRLVLGVTAVKINALIGEGTWDVVKEGIVEHQNSYYDGQQEKVNRIVERQGGRVDEQLH